MVKTEVIMPKQIPYGIANYKEIVERDCYFVNKTPYIRLHPTKLHNSYFVLHLDFSIIDPRGKLK